MYGDEYNSLHDDYQLTQHNPYIFNSKFIELSENNTSSLKTIKLQDSIYLHIPDNLLYKANMIEQKLLLIKLICLFDYILNLCYFLNGYKYGLIISGISLTGYISTVYHKKYLFLLYLGYQYMLCFSKFLATTFFIILTNDYELRKKYEEENNEIIPYNLDSTTNYEVLVFVSFLFFIIQIWVTVYCTNYYHLLPTKKEQSQIFLTFDELI
tara:strand:- start:98 stop:730 length:633 start_codon:yes stop_codon:yes gene_type:complete